MAVLLGLGLVVGLFFLFRLFGAWMFRINDVISELKEINKTLKSTSKK